MWFWVCGYGGDKLVVGLHDPSSLSNLNDSMILWNLGAALVRNRIRPPSCVEQVGTLPLVFPNFLPEHSSKEWPQHTEIQISLEGRAWKPGGSKLRAALIVFPLKSTHLCATASWSEEIYKLPPAFCLPLRVRALRETGVTCTFPSVLPFSTQTATSTDKDRPLGQQVCLSIRLQKLALYQWGLMFFNGISQFHLVLVATKTISPVPVMCYVLTCVVISAVDLCRS